MIVTNNQLGRGTGEKGDKISTIILSFVSFSPVSLPSDPYFFLFSCHTERQITPAQGNGAGWGRPVAAESTETRNEEVAREELGGGVWRQAEGQ